MTGNSSKSAAGGPLPGLLRPPLIFLVALLSAVVLRQMWPLPFVPQGVRWLGLALALGAVALFLLSVRALRAAGTPVQGARRTTAIVRIGPYSRSRNPIYLSFIVLMLGLALGLDELWLLIALVPAAAIIATVVIPREEQYLERHFGEHYLEYKTSVRRWL